MGYSGHCLCRAERSSCTVARVQSGDKLLLVFLLRRDLGRSTLVTPNRKSATM